MLYCRATRDKPSGLRTKRERTQRVHRIGDTDNEKIVKSLRPGSKGYFFVYGVDGKSTEVMENAKSIVNGGKATRGAHIQEFGESVRTPRDNPNGGRTRDRDNAIGVLPSVQWSHSRGRPNV